MYIVREIFHLQFGRYREAKALLDEGMQKHLLLQPNGSRVLTDFTGEGYRLILELPYSSLAEYEADPASGSTLEDVFARIRKRS